MAEVLDDGLELVVSEQIGWVSGGVESLVELRLERMDDQSDFEVRV